MSKQVVVISGPTGSGESTITKEVLKRCPNTVRLVTATTRAPRDAEQQGIDYYFFSKEEFARLQEAGTIIEAGYIANRDAYYGSYLPDLEQKLAQGKVVIANTQIVGSRYYKEHYNATTIFIEPESVEALAARITSRSPDTSPKELELRVADAAREMREEGPFYDFHITNADGKLEEAVQAVIELLRNEGYILE